MKQIKLSMCFALYFVLNISAQNIVKGTILDDSFEKALQGVLINVNGTEISQITSFDGKFSLKNIPNGKQVITISKYGYEIQNYPVVLEGKSINLGEIVMYLKEIYEEEDLSTITITDDELNDDASTADNISGLLQSSKDLYLRTAAFEFSGSFYRIRGLDSDNGTLMLNGIEMNKMFNGRPQWSNWGGLNDVLRNQEFINGLAASNHTFGGALGSTYINLRPSEQRSGGRVSYASSNRNYIHRLMVTYSSGILKGGWVYSISASGRQGKEGFVEGTSYNAYSIFGSVEKKIDEHHSLNLTGIFAPNRRGKSSPNTQEVYDLKGIKYTSYWGYQNGKIRNSRIKELVEPIVILNHFWDINDKHSLQTNFGYQFGYLGNSRISFNGTNFNPVTGFPEGGASNPDPTYYQKLPSYALRNFPENQGIAYGLQQQFLNDGQLNWNQLYAANIQSANAGGNAINILYEDRVDDKLFNANTIYSGEINDNITINGSLGYKKLESQNYAHILDLLGGTGFLDVDSFADELVNNPNQVQQDILNPNRIVYEGDRFSYNYTIFSNVINGFLQGQFKYNKVDFYTALTATKTDYQREGIYQNGGFPNSSLGKGEKIDFTGFGGKAGLTYKITGRHLLDINGGYYTKAPTIRNTFANSRENQAIVPNIVEEKVMSFDGSYIFRSPIVQAKATGFYTTIQDANEISFFYADGIGGDNTAFVQEILQGVNKKHFGGEFAIEAQVTPTLKLKGVAAVGQYTYDNNPDLYIASEDFVDQNSNDPLIRDFGMRYFGKTNLKNYKLPSGPQRAYSVGFEYRDPEYWWFGATINYFSNAYIDVSPIQRSSNFYTDFDGQPFNEYDEIVARELLQQEKISSYPVANLIGGKSWKIGEYYVGVFASVSNILDKEYKTGGFEQGRNANYRELLNDKSLDKPVFGSKYWYGRGTTYFVNVSFRF